MFRNRRPPYVQIVLARVSSFNCTDEHTHTAKSPFFAPFWTSRTQNFRHAHQSGAIGDVNSHEDSTHRIHRSVVSLESAGFGVESAKTAKNSHFGGFCAPGKRKNGFQALNGLCRRFKHLFQQCLAPQTLKGNRPFSSRATRGRCLQFI